MTGKNESPPEKDDLTSSAGGAESEAPQSGRQTSAEPRPWSAEETEHLKAWYGVKDDHFLARELGRDASELRDQAWLVFDVPQRHGPWSKEESDSLRAVLGALDLEMIGRMIGRAKADIEGHIIDLATSLVEEPMGIDELVRFKRLYGTRSDEDLSLVFGRTIEVIKAAGKDLCLSKDKAFLRRATGGKEKTRMPRWSKEELANLRELYPRYSNLEIAQILGRSVKSVVSKAHNLSLKKDSVRLQQMGRQNVRLRYDRTSQERADGGEGS